MEDGVFFSQCIKLHKLLSEEFDLWDAPHESGSHKE